ncbi:MAG: sugar phosphate isomerase/epimerase [Anaerolineae bacterium]
MLLAFHGATTMPQDLATDVAVAAAAGFRALEVWAAKVDRYLADHSPEELRGLFAAAGVRPITINSIEFIGFRPADEYAAIRARCRELSRIAQAIGCPTVVVVPSPTPDRNLPWADVVAEYVRVLRDLGDIAGEFGVRLSFEFLGFGWCSVRTPRAAAEIIAATDRANVGLTLDAAHFYAGGGLLSEIGRLDPARIFAFHLDDVEDGPKEAITDATRVLPGLGVVPLAEICAQLHAIGYDGPCSIELFRPEYWRWDPHELAARARTAAVRVLQSHFSVE